MIRVVCLSGTYYGYDMGEIDPYGDLEDFFNTHISGFVDSGDPVLLVEDLDDIEYFMPGFNTDDIQMVSNTDEDDG